MIFLDSIVFSFSLFWTITLLLELDVLIFLFLILSSTPPFLTKKTLFGFVLRNKWNDWKRSREWSRTRKIKQESKEKVKMIWKVEVLVLLKEDEKTRLINYWNIWTNLVYFKALFGENILIQGVPNRAAYERSQARQTLQAT